MINSGLFTSSKEDWETPQIFFDELNKKYNFAWDLASDELNHKCNNYFTEKDNSLSKQWGGLKGTFF